MPTPGPSPEALRQAGAAADQNENQEPIGAVKQPCDRRWIEVKVVNDRGVPFKKERVWLVLNRAHDPKLEKRTNDEGIARWDDVPEAGSYHVQLVDVLESWLPQKNGLEPLQRSLPKPDRFRPGDGMIHPVEVCTPAAQQTIVVNRLKEVEKISHFRDAFVDNRGRYNNARPREFSVREKDGAPRWFWGQGSVCNEHVNFFLGFWFNYNAQFTSRGVETGMDALPTYTSADQPLWQQKDEKTGKVTMRSKHRGYEEFLEKIPGGERDYYHRSLDRRVEYFRFARYVDRETCAPTGKLWERLADYNVYSIADLGGDGRETRVVSRTQQWLREHPSYYPDLPLPPGSKPGAKPPKKTNLTSGEIFDLLWELDESDPVVERFYYGVWNEKAKMKVGGLADHLNVDHHCGILYRRKDGSLYTFPADGGKQNGPLIEEKSFAEAFKSRRLLYLAIWRVKPLRDGGYAPLEAEKNAGGISVDNPSRLIEFKEGSGKPLPGSKLPVKNVKKKR
jgi:hypothetical protein